MCSSKSLLDLDFINSLGDLSQTNFASQEEFQRAFPLILLPAPLLKYAHLSLCKANELYKSVLISVKSLYQICKLVHGTMSERI